MSQEKANWNSLTLPKLKEELKRRGFSQAGNKAELVARLEQADAERDAPTVIEEDEEEEVKEVEAAEEAAEEAEADENMEGDAGNEEEKDLEGDAENTEEEAGNGAEETEQVEGDEKVVEGEEEKAAEEETTEEPKETGPTEDEKNAEIEKQFFIDMPRERDCLILTWHSKKFVVPFSSEIHLDVAAEYSQRGIRILGLNLEDMRSDKFKELVDKSSKFSFDFLERPSSKDTTGSARFVFGSVEETNQVKEELTAYKESLKIEPLKFDYKESEDDLVPSPYKSTAPVTDARPIVPRLLFVGNLPNDVTEATLKELFPDALRVIFPRKGSSEENAEKLDHNRFAYLEYASEEDVVKAAEEHKEKPLNDEKLFVIRAMSVRKERFGLLSNTLRAILIDKTRKMKRIIKNPYNKSAFELKEIEKTIASNMDKITKDTAHRESWNMPLGGLDASKIDEEEAKPIGSLVQRGRGGQRGGSRGQRPMRGSYAGSMGSRGGSRGGSSWGSPSAQRGAWNGGNGYGSYGGGRGGAGSFPRGGGGGYGGFSSGYNSFPQSFGGGFQSFGGGYGNQSFAGKRRAEDTPRGGDWKRARGGRGRGYY